MAFYCSLTKGITGNGWTISGRFRLASDEMLYHLGRAAVAVWARACLRLDVVRRAPLPAGPKIIAPNHPSTTDPFLIPILSPEHMHMLIDDTLFQVPLFGRYLRQAGHVPVIPGRGREAYQAALRLLRAGRTMGIFPEGGISPLSGGLHPPRTGVARLALTTGAPVIPVGIALQRERIRIIETPVAGETAVGTWYLGGPYAVTVGEPMWLRGDVKDRPHVRALSEQLLGRIADLAGQSARRIGKRIANSRRVRGRLPAEAAPYS